MPPNIVVYIKPCNLVHIYLIGSYTKSIRRKNPGVDIIRYDISLDYMKIIYPATVWFEIVEVPCFNLGEFTSGNEEYMDKYSSRVTNMFNKT